MVCCKDNHIAGPQNRLELGQLFSKAVEVLGIARSIVAVALLHIKIH